MLHVTTPPVHLSPSRRPARGLLAPALGAVLVLSALSALGCAHKQQETNQKANRFQADGAQAYAAGDLDRAAGLFSLALEFEPKMAEARNGLGLVALARHDKAAAEREFKIALSLNEELAEAHHNLGLLLYDRGEHDEALTRFRQALAIDPGFAPSRLGVADTLLALGRPEEARWELVKLTQVDPQNAKAHATYARVLARLNRIAAAEAAAQKALQLDPNLPHAHRARAEILMSRGEFGPAADEYRIALKVEPGNVDDRVNLVKALAGAGRHDEVDTEMVSLEKLAPARPEVPFVKGYVACQRQQYLPAIELQRRAIRLRGGRYPQARVVLAEALFASGQAGEGREELKRFLQEAPPGMHVEREAAKRFLGGGQ